MRIYQRLQLWANQLLSFFILLLLKRKNSIQGWNHYFASPLNSFRLSSGKFSIGNHLHLEDQVKLYACQGEIEIGQNVFINRQCTIVSMKKISIGSNSIFGNNVSLFDHDHNISTTKIPYKEQGYTYSEIKIGQNVWLGANSVILKGVHIGDNSIVAAGSVVTKTIAANELWAGVPAKKIRTLG